MTGFSRFGKQWASTGATLDPTDSQANAGFAFLGATPPSVELFNAIFQDSDDKDNILYGWIAAVMTAAGITPADATPSQLLQALFAVPGKNIQIFTSSGTFTVPAGVTRVEVEVWAGGGGSGSTVAALSASQAGAGGGYARKLITGLTPGAGVAVVVGAAGTGPAYSGTAVAGTTGGSSSFGGSVSATGGGGGIGANATVASNVAAGGVGSGGDLNVVGGTGNTALVTGTAGVIFTAMGGGSFGVPAAHAGGNGVTANGIIGTFPGGGASGGCNASPGANGAAGLVIVRW